MRRTLITLAAAGLLLIPATTASAHPHVAENAAHTQVLANGQNHPSFAPLNSDGLRLSCAGELEPADSGPAGYGLETAHHGPDAGAPGKGDGCFAVEGNPTDSNPAIN